MSREYYVPLPGASTPSAADVKSAREGGVGSLVKAAYRLIDAKLVPSKATMRLLQTVRYGNPVVDDAVLLRLKLQALLILLQSQSGDMDPAALEAKLQELLKLPDAALAQLMAHPDLATLNKMLNVVFQDAPDLSGVKTELEKIEVTPVPGTSEQIQVIKVSGAPQYTVQSAAVDPGLQESIVLRVFAQALRPQLGHR